MLEIWKILLDPDTMEGSVEKNRFLELFYDGCIGSLTETLAESAVPKVQYTETFCLEPPGSVAIAYRSTPRSCTGVRPTLAHHPVIGLHTDFSTNLLAGWQGRAAAGSCWHARPAGGPPLLLRAAPPVPRQVLHFAVRHGRQGPPPAAPPGEVARRRRAALPAHLHRLEGGHSMGYQCHFSRLYLWVSLEVRVEARVTTWHLDSKSPSLMSELCLQDEFYNRFLVRNNLFEPVIEVFLANGSRYNLLNSAVLELVDFVRKVRSDHLHVVT